MEAIDFLRAGFLCGFVLCIVVIINTFVTINRQIRDLRRAIDKTARLCDEVQADISRAARIIAKIGD